MLAARWSRFKSYPDFFHFPWPLWNSPTFPGFPGEWSRCLSRTSE